MCWFKGTYLGNYKLKAVFAAAYHDLVQPSALALTGASTGPPTPPGTHTKNKNRRSRSTFQVSILVFEYNNNPKVK